MPGGAGEACMLKTEIVNQLGEENLLLPAAIERALAANNRVKYYFTVLQEARRFADNPAGGATDLRVERGVAGISDYSLDTIIPNAQLSPVGTYYIPHVEQLHARIVEALAAMLEPVRLGSGEKEGKRQQQRLDKILADLGPVAGDEVAGDYIDRVTHGRRGKADSLHLLVMDLHKKINRLQAELAQEVIDGARVYALAAEHRPLVKAFMAGLNQTAPLKFDHPGLDTTATSSGRRLILENDIGTTDAHVLIIHVEDLQVKITYTDVHAQRAAFFEQLFERFAVNWKDTRSRDLVKGEDKERYFLCTGTFQAESMEQLLAYLRFLGSRIVFLIDWNKARKRLRNFLRKRDYLPLLKWAADNNFGHRGFLQVGGELIIYEALAQVSHAEFSYGDRLDVILGESRAVDFLRFVLQAAATGLLNGRSERLVRDEIKTEIFNYFQSVDEGVYEICADHAATIFDLADAVCNCLGGELGRPDEVARMAALAKRWESRADDLLNRIREVTRRSGEGGHIRRIAEQADNVADSLEEAAHLLTLLPARPYGNNLLPQLQKLAELVVEGVRGYVRCVETARQLEQSNIREDRQAFLEAVDDVLIIEHRTDAGERRLLKELLAENVDSRALLLGSRLGQSFEEAADALAGCALLMKDYVITEVMTP